jgi:hypothetical protein
VEDFFAGVSESLVENFGGTGAGSVYGSPDSTAYYAGKIFGDVTSTVVGKAISGGGAALTGVGVSTSEVGVGVPVVAAGIAVTAYGTKVTASGVANGVKDARKFLSSSKSGSSRLSGKEAAKAAEKLGFKKTNYRSHGKPVFQKGNRYITPDVDAHNGGSWKMANSVENLGRKNTRMGTYDADLNRIGD